jgi:transposase InsO family protein
MEGLASAARLSLQRLPEQQIYAPGTETENQKGSDIKRVRSDGGGEFASQDAQKWAKKNGIQWEYTAPYAPDQNESGIPRREMSTERGMSHL